METRVIQGYLIQPGAGLYKANLPGAELRNADLRGANLSSANLGGADLSFADLRGACLLDADLHDTNLLGANLFSATLRGADLRGANLCSADLRSANLRDTNLRGANFHGADLCHAFGPFAIVKLGRHFAWGTVSHIGIGCLMETHDWWLKNYRRMGKEYFYSSAEIKRYFNWIKSVQYLRKES